MSINNININNFEHLCFRLSIFRTKGYRTYKKKLQLLCKILSQRTIAELLIILIKYLLAPLSTKNLFNYKKIKFNHSNNQIIL